MKADRSKYEIILDILRNSKPVLTNPEEVSEKVIRALQKEKSKVSLMDLLIEFLFGWVYVGWVRRSMIAVTMVIVLFFGFQNAIILKRIKDLSSQKIEDGIPVMTSLKEEMTNKIQTYKKTPGKFSDKKKSASKEEVDEMIKTFNLLQVKYKDIIDSIKNDPQLKEYVESRMNVNQKAKH
jgi:hypothetical protein